MRRKHPRTRGRNVESEKLSLVRTEASPHAGKELTSGSGGKLGQRSIPARGEGTACVVKPIASTPKHPRTRGRNGAVQAEQVAALEASPHAGKERCPRQSPAIPRGSIPARGEGTDIVIPTLRQEEKHPRTRGRNRSARSPSRCKREASPHAGKELFKLHRHFNVDRSIPARGEGTPWAQIQTQIRRKHPRTRGRNPSRRTYRRRWVEASPHAGKELNERSANVDTSGSIPARGEGTIPDESRPAAVGKHPRTRGRNRLPKDERLNRREASPHAGKERARFSDDGSGNRSIPARGEGTPSGQRAVGCRWKHPRTRGRNLLVTAKPAAAMEASPHAGKEPLVDGSTRRCDGSIPARGEGTRTGPRAPSGTPKHPRTRGRN